MNQFIAYNPTKLHFGHGVVNGLGANAEALGKHALLVYGGGSVLRNGSYHDTLAQLQLKGIEVTEYSGIKPNPLVDHVNEAAQLGKAKGVDMVVAVGGGSVIDSAKIVALCIASECEAWQVMTGGCTPEKALPLMAVLTLAATGTEMNGVAVLQNMETMEKIGYRNEMIYPAHSFLDPTYTISVPPDYTAYGIVDLIAHCLEAWFGKGDASLSDKFVVSIIREAMESGPLLMNDPANYDLRARIMWAATNALNNTTIYGRDSGDWGVHALGHVLSFLYDTAHGATLSIIYPAWLKVMKERAGEQIREIGMALFGTDTVEAAIAEFEALFTTLGSPVRCQQASIDDSKKGEILSLMNRNKAGGLHYRLTDSERESIAGLIFS